MLFFIKEDMIKALTLFLETTWSGNMIQPFLKPYPGTILISSAVWVTNG